MAVSVTTASMNEMNAAIVVGPVIGYVSDSTARVLIETNQSCAVTCILTPRLAAPAAESKSAPGSDAPDVAVRRTLRQEFTAYEPAVFRFFGLHASTRYDVSFAEIANSGKRKGGFKTLPAVVEHYTVVCAACDKDKPKNRGPVLLWNRIWETYLAPHAAGAADTDLPEELNMVIHHGDQVYADSAYDAAKHMFDDQADLRSNKEKVLAATRTYQEVYRRVWNRPETARVLAHIPNLCVWDDHEVRNDWGAKADDRTPGTVAYLIGTGARQAYWWYQRQLWDDLPGSEALVRRSIAVQRGVDGSEAEASLHPPSRAVLSADDDDDTTAAAACTPALEQVPEGGSLPESPHVDARIPRNLDVAQGAIVATTAGTPTAGSDRTAIMSGVRSSGSVKLRVESSFAGAGAGAGAGTGDDGRGLFAALSFEDGSLMVPSPSHFRSPPSGTIEAPATECVRKLLPGGKVGLFLVDMRGSLSFMYDAKGRSYFGERQWADMENAYGAAGLFKDCTTVLAVHSSPALLFGSCCASACSCLSKDKMGLGLHPSEQQAYLDLLCEWVAAKPSGDGARDIFLVGGDMHFAVSTTVKRDGKPVLRQLITSAISNKPPFWFQFYLFRAIMGCCPRNGPYTWSHSDYYPAQNYAVVHMDAAAGSIAARVEKSRWVCCDYRGCCYC